MDTHIARYRRCCKAFRVVISEVRGRKQIRQRGRSEAVMNVSGSSTSRLKNHIFAK